MHPDGAPFLFILPIEDRVMIEKTKRRNRIGRCRVVPSLRFICSGVRSDFVGFYADHCSFLW